MAEPGTRFVLKRLNWYEHYDGGMVREGGEVSLSSFATFEEAEAERGKREEEIRKTINPFDCGKAVHYWSHLDEPRLRDWLMDHGIDPPSAGKNGKTNWAEWWKKTGKKLSSDKQLLVWEALDKVRFFVVREEPVRKVGYAVLGINWEYNDEFYDANSEGGHLVKVYRSRARAEEECAALNAEARDDWGFVDEFAEEYADEMEDDESEYDMAMFDMRDRLRRKRGLTSNQKLKKGEGLYNSIARVPFYEVIEVELEGIE
ncbi:MAG: hypothetical protein L0241_24460 [Planctomycetia bacterium]|nr:hypothetical protein [Planctomycetia bacterium]